MEEDELELVLPLILIFLAVVTPLIGVFVTLATWILLIRRIALDPPVSHWWWK